MARRAVLVAIVVVVVVAAVVIAVVRQTRNDPVTGSDANPVRSQASPAKAQGHAGNAYRLPGSPVVPKADGSPGKDGGPKTEAERTAPPATDKRVVDR